MPVAANFLLQKVFPAPDMPIRARRRGLFLLISASIKELPTIACSARRRQLSRTWVARKNAFLEPVLEDGLRRTYAGGTVGSGCCGLRAVAVRRFLSGAPGDFFSSQLCLLKAGSRKFSTDVFGVTLCFFRVPSKPTLRLIRDASLVRAAKGADGSGQWP